MKLLVFGQTGQVATELARRAPDAIYLSRNEADLANPATCAKAIKDYRPDTVINAAAYTAVDRAEEEEDLAYRINAEAPDAIAKACAKHGTPLIQISTDYVFDGSGTQAWHPHDPPSPINAYGRTKLAGEEAVRDAGGTHAIVRTSWVFSAHGANFVKTMLRLAQSRTELNVVNDQIGGPSHAGDIASACLTLSTTLREAPEKAGTYHYSGTPDVSWKEFADEIFTRTGHPMSISGIPTNEWPTPAARPLNSRLDCSSLEVIFGVPRPDWRKAVDNVLKELS